MKTYHIAYGIIVIGISFSLGMIWSESHITCPGNAEKTLATLESTPAEKAQFCADLMPEPVTLECMPDVRYETITVVEECDCTMEMEAGRVNGWAECVKAEKMVTSQKEITEYCDEHYCQEKILRNTRPTTK